MIESTNHPLWHQFQQDFESVNNAEELTRTRDKYLSRQRGLLTLELRKLSTLKEEERPAAGKALNELRVQLEEALERRQEEIRERERKAQLEDESIDVTYPGFAFPVGKIHPLRRVQDDLERIFVSMGFTVASGPEVETDYYNFEALNMPEGHPARDAQDTLYLPGGLLLRAHTSPVQIRTMEKMRPPVRIVAPGRVFRRDAVDATHSPMFHQMEILVIDEGITMGDLKGTLEAFFHAVFSPGTQVRLRPSYFPFVEPGAEVDISCIFCQGSGCGICKQSGWIEILGAGMVHPHILERVGYDPDRYTGFAWGMGIDRIAQLIYRVDDMRLFFENDVRFLDQFL
jgi:phenylalanyl-tRNA synthetase alpha chain